MSEVALVSVAFFRGTAFNGTFSDDLSAVEEAACLLVEELHSSYLIKLSLFVERADEPVCDLGVYLLGASESGGCEEVGRDAVVVESFLLFVVVALNEVLERALEFAVLDLNAPALSDRGAVAVGTADEDDVFLAYAVTHEAGVCIRENEHTSHMTEVELLVAVGHTAGDNGSFREYRTRYLEWTFVLIILVCHIL